MTRRSHTPFLVCLLIGLAAVLGANAALAQDFMPPSMAAMEMQPPFMAPQKTNLCNGVFYAGAGAKWWSLWQIEVRLDDERLPGFVLEAQVLPNQIWGPTLEVGFQSSDYFDLFAGFAYYNLTDRFARNVLDGGLTTQMSFTYELSTTAYEFRQGGRSWFPFYGMGRIGVNLGVLASVIPFEVHVQQVLTGAFTALRSGTHKDLWIHVAGFAGVELELDYRRFFAKSAAEIAYGTSHDYKNLLGLETHYNPSAVSVSAMGGFRF